jgi:hypothetical protein
LLTPLGANGSTELSKGGANQAKNEIGRLKARTTLHGTYCPSLGFARRMHSSVPAHLDWRLEFQDGRSWGEGEPMLSGGQAPCRA